MGDKTLMMGETYRSYYSDHFMTDIIGIITGSSAVSQLPNVPGMLFKLEAWKTNIGPFYIGTRSGTNQQGWELTPGYDTGWFNLSADNLNELFFKNPSGSTQILGYWIQK